MAERFKRASDDHHRASLDLPRSFALWAALYPPGSQLAVFSLGKDANVYLLLSRTFPFRNTNRITREFGRVFAQFFQEPQQCEPFVF